VTALAVTDANDRSARQVVASELHPETQELLASADPHVLDTLRAAKERGAILLTDKLALRRLAQVEDVLSVWTLSCGCLIELVDAARFARNF
jgi:hypothetical protein